MLIFLTNLFGSGQMKWSQCLGRAVLHGPKKDCQSLLIRDLFVRFWEWPEASMMLHENSEVVPIMVCRNIWLEDVESIPVEKADKLHGRRTLISGLGSATED
jgi:hypothetical protein